MSFALALRLTPFLIRLLRRSGVGQPIHDDMHHHTQKAGTPTMGGAVVPLALLTVFPVALAVSGHPPSRVGVAAALAVVAMGAVGLLDDGMKVFHERNLGLRELQKTVLQTLVSLGYALAVVTSPGSYRQLAFANCEHTALSLPSWLYVLVRGLPTSAVVYRMETNGVMAMPVLGAEERIVGVVHLHDLMRARVA